MAQETTLSRTWYCLGQDSGEILGIQDSQKQATYPKLPCVAQSKVGWFEMVRGLPQIPQALDERKQLAEASYMRKPYAADGLLRCSTMSCCQLSLPLHPRAPSCLNNGNWALYTL